MKRTMITIAAAGALLAAGCGSSNQDFVSEFNAAQQPLLEATSELVGTKSDDVDAYAAAIGRLAGAYDEAAASMRALYAPEGAEDELEAYVKELDASSALVQRVS